MPTYEYKCTACAERFEVEQKITDDPLTSLPGCDASGSGDHQLKKVFSSIGIAFKGQGFYRNDARGGKSSTKSASTSGEGGSSSSSEASSGSGSSSSNGDSGTKAASSSAAD